MAPVATPVPLLPGPSRTPHFGVQQGSQPHPSPVTAVWNTGFENQVAAYTTAGSGLCNVVSGTIGAATDQARSGAASLKYQAAGSTTNIAPQVSASSVTVYRGYHRFQALPTGANSIVVTCPQTNQNSDIILTTAGVLQAQVETGVAVNGPTIVAGQWYRIEARFDGRNNPTLIEWMVDGVAQTTATFAQAPQSIQDIRIGSTGTATITGWIDDVIVSQTASDYPIGPGYSVLYEVTGKGTHAPGSGTFQDDTAAAITDAGDSTTQSWLRLDEQPPSQTDYVTQTVADANGYLEYSFADSVEPNTPNSVSITFASAASSTASTCDISTKANDNGSLSPLSTNTSAQTTLWYATQILATRPATGRWTLDAFNSLLVRAGYAADAAPAPRIAAIWVEVDYAAVYAGTSYTDSGNIPITASLSGAERVASIDSGTLPVTLAVSGTDQLASTGVVPVGMVDRHSNRVLPVP